MNSLQTFSLLPDNKREFEAFKAQLKDDLLMLSDMRALQQFVKMKVINKLFEDITKDEDVNRHFRDEFDRFNSKTVNVSDFVELTKKGRTTYDYSTVNDSVLNELEAEKSKIEEQIKLRKQLIDSGFNPETGEVFEKPSIKSSTEFLETRIK